MKRLSNFILSSSRLSLLIFFILLAIWRVALLQHSMGLVSLYSPVGAIALCLGLYYRNRMLPYLSFVAFMLVSDFLIMQVLYPSEQGGFLYKGWITNYICLMLIIVIGKLLSGKVTLIRVVAGGIASSVVYFLASNALVWYLGKNVLTGLPFEKSLSGLVQSYTLALPFFRNFLIGTIAYGVAFYFIVEVLLRLKRNSSPYSAS